MQKLILYLALLCSIVSCSAPKHGCRSTWDMSGYGFFPTPTQLEHQTTFGYMYCTQTNLLIISSPSKGNIVAAYFIKNNYARKIRNRQSR